MIELKDVSKNYRRANAPVSVLKNLNLSIPQGAFAAFMGPSGSGKSTLLNIIAGLDTPTSGSVVVSGVCSSSMSDRERTLWRARHVGFVFQTYNMMPTLTAVENVEMPLLLARMSKRDRRARAEAALRIVGLEHRMHHFPRELSGGQEQRVTLARAIVTDPVIIVADEPTGDLDRKSADEILDLLGVLNKEHGKTILMVTHDPNASERAQRHFRIEDGALVSTSHGVES
jgi:putative ABC transport system ATP-binding protein